ncbi:oxygen-independent coproporphyrinogen III oxidase [Kiloniella majae]|uniref:oxygen-independent coproporphyrinogen III oxidase n=1 Tax=Kiloniella majae TaxID=1938558 RepID=UPI000A27968D|nr:oxygen-independent coproporphyrinogen III oxidase [Kiloniella majae]
MKTEIIQKYDKGVPRYTSYPTAHLFKPDFEDSTYVDWLQAIPKEMPLSLYSHIPYCDSLCWFCGCHTKITQKYKPIKEYMGSLQKEILMTATAMGRGRPVNHMHFGGGSPTILEPEDVKELFQTFNDAFSFTGDAEIAVEIDPRDISQEAIRAWAQGGVNRASLGVQDVQDKVQRAINRIQPIEQTAKVAKWLHEEGVHGINMDLMYGLPYQTVESVLETIRQVMTMAPERIALFGYAHIPSLKPHQRLIPEEVLPDFNERFEQQEAAAELLQSYGFVRIGLDHFAKPDDPMAVAFKNGTLRRNFQGYTTDKADAMIGFGASSIGALPSGFVQNIVAIRNYRAAIDSGNFAVAKSIPFKGQDKLRAAIIEQLMCYHEVDLNDICDSFQSSIDEFDYEIRALKSFIDDKVARYQGGVISVEHDARALVRSVCALFDEYHGSREMTYSQAV